MKTLKIKFDRHGLGDVIHWAHAVQLYRTRGYDVTIQAEENKLFVWKVSGVKIVQGGGLPDHNYGYPSDFDDLSKPDYEKNKVAFGLQDNLMPKLDATAEQLWDELCAVKLSAHDHIPQEAHDEAEKFLEGLPRPIIAFHSRGTNWHERKSIPTEIAFETILGLMQQTGGSVVVLDFDERAPMVGSQRCKGIKPSWGHIGIDRLCALYERCDLMIGVDSGPFHVAAMTDVKALGVFRQLHPTRVCLPNKNAVYLASDQYEVYWQDRRDTWNIRTYSGEEPSAEDIVDSAIAILSGSTNAKESYMQMNELAGRYTYSRVGHDSRTIELMPNGTIGEGVGDCEKKWFARMQHGEMMIAISGKHGVICDCSRGADGVFRGHWTQFEKMPIELIPLNATARTNTVAGSMPNQKITLVMNWDEKYNHIAQIVLQNRRDYATQHGYQLRETTHDGSWGKLTALLDAWDSADWLWWLDADACITNMNLRLESILQQCPADSQVVITCDRNGISCGSMLIRPCPEVRAIFEDLLNRKEEFDWPNGLWEQNGLMWMFWKIKNQVCVLPQSVMNSYAETNCAKGSVAWKKGDFVLHCAGLKDDIRIQRLTAVVSQSKPNPYDIDRYKGIWKDPEWSMDQRHIFMIFEVLMTGSFENAIEIGSLHGASSTAFIEAVNRGKLESAVLCDTEIRQSLKDMVQRSTFPERIQCVQAKSSFVLAFKQFDFVLVDGDHTLETVKEEVDLLLAMRPVCVMAHDTNSTVAGVPGCEGAQYLKQRFEAESGYLTIEDYRTRTGERTERGLFLATTSQEVFEVAKRIFERE